MQKVLYTSLIGDDGPHFEILQNAGFVVENAVRQTDPYTEDQMIEMLVGYSAVIAGSEPYSRRVVSALDDLRVIARTGVGFDAVDLAACDERGIVVTTTPGVNHHSVAEHTIAMLMGLARGFPELDRKVRANDWERNSFPRAMGKTLGIVGLGRIGKAVATRAIGLGMKVLAYEPNPDAQFVEKWNIELFDFDNLLSNSDYVSVHAPATKDNYHLFNTEAFSKMKPGSVFINTARGTLVDETALCAALESGHLRAAGLDVFEKEPLSLDSPLLKFQNVMLAGHVGGLDEESKNDMDRMCAETIVALYKGDWPEDCILNLSESCNTWKW